MENQSIALAKMLNNNFKLIYYNPPYFLKKFPLLGKIYTPYFLQQKLKAHVLPSIIITTGSRMAGSSIAVKSFLKNNVDEFLIPMFDMPNPKQYLEQIASILIPI